MRCITIGVALMAILAAHAAAGSQRASREDVSVEGTAQSQKARTFYQIDDERYVYSYGWKKTDGAIGPGLADGSTRVDGKPWAFNWCCRRDPVFMISGDVPRIALARRYKLPTTVPPIISFGDLRIRCTVDGKSYLLDEAGDIKTLFHPWGTEHKISLKPEVPLLFDVRATLVENRGMAIRVLASADSEAPVDAQIELIYGGVCDKGNAQQVATYFVASPEDAKANTLTPIPGGIEISSPGISSKVAVIADQADKLTIAPADSKDIAANRAVFKYRISLNRNARALHLIAYEVGSLNRAALTLDDFEKYHNDAEAYYSKLLAPFEINSPDPILNAGFYTALVNLDYVYESPAWLEGVHCWSAPLVNNYPISAAVCLGQMDRARGALRFFADTPEGPCPARNSDGSSMTGLVFNFEEGIPYYIEQLYRYWYATGDDATVNRVWDSLVRNFEKYWTVRDPEGNGLLNYHESCNCFLYQADHLSLPGDAFSPSAIMADCLDKMAEMAGIRNDTKSAAMWRHRADYMRSELIRKLWSPDQGKFAACIDNQGFPMQANYYTDFVFPELYSGLPAEYSWISLKTLDRTLWVGDHLMRVGNLKPSLFGNDNVMPVQMSEAAEAYCKAGRSDEGYRLLHGTAFGASIYTDSPGSFPERMSDTGFGLSDYLFGNPTSAFIRGTVAGLFGIERASKDHTMTWHPAIPDGWKSAGIKLGDISVSVTGLHGDRTYSISLPHVQSLDFRVPLHGHQIDKVIDADGHGVQYEMQPHPSGGFLQIHAGSADRYVFHVVSTKPETSWKMPTKLRAGREISLRLPSSGMSIVDPQNVFANFRVDGDSLAGRSAQATGQRTFFVAGGKGRSMIPVDVDFGAPKTIAPDLSMRPGKREHLALDSMFNSETIQSRNMWRLSPVSLDLTKAVKDGDLLAVDGYSFRARPSGKNILLVEVGDLRPYTNALRLSDKPNSVRITVGRPVKGIEFLMVSEWKVRLTGMQVGVMKLHYADGAEQAIPLINGHNTGSLNARFADGVINHELEWLKNIYVLPIEVDPTRMLEHVEITVNAPDGSIGILGANVMPN